MKLRSEQEMAVGVAVCLQVYAWTDELAVPAKHTNGDYYEKFQIQNYYYQKHGR
jgi:hypothetical protein